MEAGEDVRALPTAYRSLLNTCIEAYRVQGAARKSVSKEQEGGPEAKEVQEERANERERPSQFAAKQDPRGTFQGGGLGVACPACGPWPGGGARGKTPFFYRHFSRRPGFFFYGGGWDKGPFLWLSCRSHTHVSLPPARSLSPRYVACTHGTSRAPRAHTQPGGARRCLCGRGRTRSRALGQRDRGEHSVPARRLVSFTAPPPKLSPPHARFSPAQEYLGQPLFPL